MVWYVIIPSLSFSLSLSISLSLFHFFHLVANLTLPLHKTVPEHSLDRDATLRPPYVSSTPHRVYTYPPPRDERGIYPDSQAHAHAQAQRINTTGFGLASSPPGHLRGPGASGSPPPPLRLPPIGGARDLDSGYAPGGTPPPLPPPPLHVPSQQRDAPPPAKRARTAASYSSLRAPEGGISSSSPPVGPGTGKGAGVGAGISSSPVTTNASETRGKKATRPRAKARRSAASASTATATYVAESPISPTLTIGRNAPDDMTGTSSDLPGSTTARAVNLGIDGLYYPPQAPAPAQVPVPAPASAPVTAPAIETLPPPISPARSSSQSSQVGDVDAEASLYEPSGDDGGTDEIEETMVDDDYQENRDRDRERPSKGRRRVDRNTSGGTTLAQSSEPAFSIGAPQLPATGADGARTVRSKVAVACMFCRSTCSTF